MGTNTAGRGEELLFNKYRYSEMGVLKIPCLNREMRCCSGFSCWSLQRARAPDRAEVNEPLGAGLHKPWNPHLDGSFIPK